MRTLSKYILLLLMIGLFANCNSSDDFEIENVDSFDQQSKTVEAFKEVLERDMDLVQERIEKARQLGESLSKDEVLNQSLTNSFGGTINIPLDFATIQEAIDVSVPGDVIIVDGGVHRGCIIEGKNDLIIRGINATIISDGFYESSFFVYFSDGITIENFTIRADVEHNIADGVLATGSNGIRIANNKFYGLGNSYNARSFGIVSLNCSETEIIENEFYNHYQSIRLNNENGSTLKDNTIKDSYAGGVIFLRSNYNNVIDLEVSEIGMKVSEGDPNVEYAGIVLANSSRNSFRDVEIKENQNGLVVWSFQQDSGYNYFSEIEVKDNQKNGIILANLGFGRVVNTYIWDSESKSNGVCDFLDLSYTFDYYIWDSEIGTICN